MIFRLETQFQIKYAMKKWHTYFEKAYDFCRVRIDNFYENIFRYVPILKLPIPNDSL